MIQKIRFVFLLTSCKSVINSPYCWQNSKGTRPLYIYQSIYPFVNRASQTTHSSSTVIQKLFSLLGLLVFPIGQSVKATGLHFPSLKSFRQHNCSRTGQVLIGHHHIGMHLKKSTSAPVIKIFYEIKYTYPVTISNGGSSMG